MTRLARSPLRSIAMLLAAALALALLGGCASTFTLENKVQTFSSLPAVPANPRYRLERLPSQQSSPAQDGIEALADPALYAAGLRRDDAQPAYSVQVSARVQRVLSPWAEPWDDFWPGWGPGWHGFARPMPRLEQPWFQREVAVILRDLATGKVVYETHAMSDGPWTDNAAVLPAMFQAALHGFPQAPAGPRRVDVRVGAPHS